MPDTSSNLTLPYILPSQAQKHVTHNEAIRALDALVQLSVLASDQTTPPTTPADGDCYVVAPGGVLDWAGQDGAVASFGGTTWDFFAPRAGWRAFDQARGTLIVYDGTDWGEIHHADLQEIEKLGIATTATPAAPFAAKLNAAQWMGRSVADGGNGDMLTLFNRETDSNVVGTVYQTGFVTRALVGQFGSNSFRISVSPDGISFQDAIAIAQDTGQVDLPYLPRFKASTNYDNLIAVDVWTKIGINTVEFNDQGVFDAGTNLFTAPATGTYLFGASGLFKKVVTVNARMRMRMLKNGTTEINGSFGENSAPHADELSALWVQTMAHLTAGDTVEVQGTFRGEDGYFAADHTTFWGYKVG